MRKALVIAAWLGIVNGVAARAQTGDDSLIDADVVLSLGGFLMSTNTTVRLDGSTSRAGTEIDLEEDLGFGDADRFRFDGLWRISPRHHLRGAWFQLDREVERRVDRELDFGDIVIPVQGELSADLRTGIGQLAYEYAFVHRDNYEIAGSIGVHAIRFELELVARLAGAAEERSERAETSAPLPVVGLRGLWRLGGDFYFDAAAQYFQAEIDEYDGDLQDYRATIVWMPARHFALGAGYNDFRVNVDVDARNFTGRLSWEYDGAILFGSLVF